MSAHDTIRHRQTLPVTAEPVVQQIRNNKTRNNEVSAVGLLCCRLQGQVPGAAGDNNHRGRDQYNSHSEHLASDNVNHHHNNNYDYNIYNNHYNHNHNNHHYNNYIYNHNHNRRNNSGDDNGGGDNHRDHRNHR